VLPFVYLHIVVECAFLPAIYYNAVSISIDRYNK
jgi:hypothetical protein